MRNLTCIVSILLLIILGGTSPSCGEQKSVKQLTKIINCDGVLYMSNERNSTVTLVAVNVKEKEDVGREFLLPATTASSYGKYLFCWDIFNKHIFFISVSEFEPYILSNKQITVWKYDSSNWQEQYTVKADFEGPFNVISQNNKTYLFNKE